MRVTIESYGESIVNRELVRFGRNTADLTDAMRDVGTIMREASEAQFRSEGGYASGGWPPLSDSRIAYKARHDLAPEILRATDTLMNSLTRKFDPLHVEHASADSLRFGSLVRYGIYHQSSRPRTKIPFRPPIALTELDKRRIVRTLQESILEGVRA